MEKILVLLVLLAGCYSQPEDQTGRVFIFPRRSAVDYVRLTPSLNSTVNALKAITICQRFLSSDKDGQTLFSVATKCHHNSPLLYKYADRYEVYMRVTKDPLTFWGLPNNLNEWHSYCFTWESNTGLVQLWVNGVNSAKQMGYKGGSIEAAPSMILGQDQDSYGGGFAKKNAFVGHVTDVHVWDKVISDCDIRDFTEGSSFKPGNVINWHRLEFTMGGEVVLEDQQKCCEDE
ncbi:C-reactive protein-like [Megalops cyprinoides]|uniref:C-reactive protein-like n=1 Tax=Megalops cyprinoides TaxID=118141 RepID=UPI001863EE85|nr:C-reactive protein-like [Megalops cyprinoides]